MNDLELKVYEALGVKKFKNFVLNLFSFIHRKNRRSLMRYRSNYNIGKIQSTKDVISFKKKLLFNASCHVYGLFMSLKLCLVSFNIYYILAGISLSILNIYCIMLQRYNHIRINKLIKKMEPIEEKKKEKLKDEIKDLDKSLKEHTYSLVDDKSKETSINLEEFIESCDLISLKELRDYLELYNRTNNLFSDWSEDLEETEKVFMLNYDKILKLKY